MAGGSAAEDDCSGSTHEVQPCASPGIRSLSRLQLCAVVHASSAQLQACWQWLACGPPPPCPRLTGERHTHLAGDVAWPCPPVDVLERREDVCRLIPVVCRDQGLQGQPGFVSSGWQVHLPFYPETSGWYSVRLITICSRSGLSRGGQCRCIGRIRQHNSTTWQSRRATSMVVVLASISLP